MSQYPIPPGALNALAGILSTRHVLLVTYDLRTPTHNSNPFYEALRNQGEWWHYLTSTWLIYTNKTSQSLYGSVVQYITTSDSLLIVPVKKPYWGYLPKDAWDWINARLTD